jgi:hypothetical protein
MTDLINITRNEAPFLRADWFFCQSARQIDRDEQQVVGYYDFLAIKKEADIEALAGLDRKTADRLRRELAAIVPSSIVTLHNRQLWAIQDGYWESRDTDSNKGDKNSTRQLDADYKFIAKEVYFRLPNTLWGFAAVNAVNGNLAASVPDVIASDHRSSSNDARIHPCLSCIRCHVEGLRPINDWARTFYAQPPGDTALIAYDKDKSRRLHRLYLGPLFDRYEDDQRVYTRTLKRLTGWEPKELAAAYADTWREYADTVVEGAQLAHEFGVDQKMLLSKVKRFVSPVQKGGGGSTDPILIAYLKDPEVPMRREYVEEAYILFLQALGYEEPKSQPEAKPKEKRGEFK